MLINIITYQKDINSISGIKELQKTINLGILTSNMSCNDVTASFRVNWRIVYQHNTHDQPITKIDIYRVLIDKVSDNKAL